MNDTLQLQKKRFFLPGTAVLFSFFSVKWALSVDNSFVFDDWSSLANARFSSWENLFRMFPQASYNDRSMGWLMYKLLNQLFGLNAQPYHMVYVAMHLVNVLLVYFVMKKLAERFSLNEEARWIGFFTALFWGAYPVSLMAVSWISATFEMQCCNFILFSLLFYLKAEEKTEYSFFYAVLAFLAYWLSLRSKEMSLAFPVILIVYESAKCVYEKKRWRLPWHLWAQLGFMLIYAFMLFTGGQSSFSQTNPYHQNFNPLLMLRNVLRYIVLYFDPFNPDMAYTSMKSTAIPGIVFFFVGVVVALYLAIKKQHWYCLLSLVAAAGALVVVLPMENMQHRLYLYIPSVFVSLFFAFLIMELHSWRQKKGFKEAAVLGCIVVFCFNYASGVTDLQNYWLSVCERDQDQISQLNSIKKPVNYTQVYVVGAKKDYNIFYYGPGSSLRLLYDDATLHTALVDEFPKSPESPYLFLKYDNGTITEVKRDETIPPQVKIDQVYPNQIDASEVREADGSVTLSLTGVYDWNDLEIRLNGVSIPFVQGENFCSFSIPSQYIQKGETLEITLYSQQAYGESEAFIVPIV